MKQLRDILQNKLEKIWDWNKFYTSIFWWVLKNVFLTHKNIDLTSEIKSIKITENKIIVKTNNPILNSSLQNYNSEILEQFLEKIWKKREKFTIKYI